MGVGAAHSEGADARDAGFVAGFPIAIPGYWCERAVGEIDARIGSLEVEQRGDLAVAELLDRLDESGDAGGAVEVADVGLAGADGAEAVRVRATFAEGLGEGGDFDGVAERGAGAMGLDVGNIGGRDAGGGLGERDDLRLGVHAGGGEADLVRAVVVDGPALDDGEDRVAVGDGLAEALEQDHAAAVAEHGAGGIGVEGAAGSVRRDHAVFLIEVFALLREADGDAAGERHVALIGEQRCGGLADGDERGGACRLDGHAGPAEVELVGDADGEEVLVVAEHRLVFGNLIVFREFAAGAEVVEEVGVEA